MEGYSKTLTVFQQENITEPALFSPCDTTEPIDNFPEISVSTFSENIIKKFASIARMLTKKEEDELFEVVLIDKILDSNIKLRIRRGDKARTFTTCLMP